MSLPEYLIIDDVPRPTTNSLGQPINPTEEGVRNFWAWFGNSKCVDADGRPLVRYHGSNRAGFSAFDLQKIDKHHCGFFFTSDPAVAATYGSDKPVEIREAPEIKSVIDLRRFLDQQQETIDGKRLALFEHRQVLDDETGNPWIYTYHDLTWTGKGSTGRLIFSEIGEYHTHNDPAELKRLIHDAREHLAIGPQREGLYEVYLALQNPLVIDANNVPWNAVEFEGGPTKISAISHVAAERGHDGLIVRNAYDSFFMQTVPSDVHVVFDARHIKSANLNSGRFDPASPSLTDATPVMTRPQPNDCSKNAPSLPWSGLNF